MPADTAEGTGGYAEETAEAFSDALDDLKAQGSTLLLLGPVGGDAMYAGCRRLLGDELVEDRRRLFVMTDGQIEHHQGAKATCKYQPPADAHAINYRTQARSVASATATDHTDIPAETVEGGLDELYDRIEAAVERLDDRADGLEPGELRLCLDSVDSLLAHENDEDVFEFLDRVEALVDQYNGMAHVHLPLDFGSAPVDQFADAFDAIVEVEAGDNAYRQRWHLQDLGLSTGWLKL
ncbi:DUF7504 family protein [Halospeciosus flavus]|uniref:Uncharacterized protein n=1 Tax=Halospeciosus flavus TaxID=3032283 RepID=A0ABD5Z2S2_9EURY|nr:hypothetical protein [Halospeciosus flavus]